MKINWLLVGLAAALFLVKKKPAATKTEEPVGEASLKQSVILGDLDLGDNGTAWLPGW